MKTTQPYINLYDLHGIIGGCTSCRDWLRELLSCYPFSLDEPPEGIVELPRGQYGITMEMAGIHALRCGHFGGAIAYVLIEEYRKSKDPRRCPALREIRRYSGIVMLSWDRVDAVMLHRFLKSKRPFDCWLNDWIRLYRMENQVDYRIGDSTLSIKTAMKIALNTHNARGQAVADYYNEPEIFFDFRLCRERVHEWQEFIAGHCSPWHPHG